jgi:ferrous iron transport protein B
MIVGFGCTVPAILATRTLDNKWGQVHDDLHGPFMSCGARLPVSPVRGPPCSGLGRSVVFSIYMVGIVLAVLTGSS